MRIKSSKKTRERKRGKAELDAAARQACFERDRHTCVRCGRKPPQVRIQWCHVIGRRHLCTRWEPDNHLTMCGGCHMFWHEYPTLSGDWFRKNWPERHEHILALYNAGGKVNVKELVKELRCQ
jgi:5-methylcytosine-specific restriction endonuclease McrA